MIGRWIVRRRLAWHFRRHPEEMRELLRSLGYGE